MSDRLTVDTITSDQLDALQLRAARMEHDTKQAAELAVRLEDPEAALERVRERCQAVRDRVGPGGMINASQILGLLSPTWPDGNYEATEPGAALDEPKEG